MNGITIIGAIIGMVSCVYIFEIKQGEKYMSYYLDNSKTNKKVRVAKGAKSIFVVIIILMLVVGVNGISAYATDNIHNVPSIPQDAFVYNGHSYKVYESLLQWKEAKGFCEELNGHLATITSDGEWQFVLGLAKSYQNTQFWLGGTDERLEGQWEWVTGEKWSFSAWMKGQPDNDGGQDYLQITYNPSEWTDRQGTDLKYFICEWDYTDDTNSKRVYIPDYVYSYGNHYYKYYPYSMTWYDAKEYCENLGGHLATVSSEDEWSFIQSKAIANTGHFWLGATDEKLKGEWCWVTGEPWTFTAWSNNYPNSDSNANYLYISSTRDYLWYNWTNTLDTNAKNGFICEWDYCCISTNGYFDSHDWGDWRISQEASCLQSGEKNRVCKKCGECEVVSLEQLSHKYGEIITVKGSILIPPIVKERTCELCGNIDHIEDWSCVWVTVLVGIAIIGAIIGVIGYIRAFISR